MTLAAPRSRQGKATLVLAFLAATVAVVAAFSFLSGAFAQPGNDNYANRYNLGTGLAAGDPAGQAFDATTEANEPFNCGGDDQTVWYDWTADATGSAVVATTYPANFDSVLAVYTGTQNAGNAGWDLALVGCNDDGGPPTDPPGFFNTAQVNFNAVAGTTYHIQVAAWSSSEACNDDDADPSYGDCYFNLQLRNSVESLLTLPTGGAIRHVDLDWANEEAAGNLQGILDGYDDPDDATASQHMACLFSDNPVYDPQGAADPDQGYFTPDNWVITNTEGSPTVNNKDTLAFWFDTDADGNPDYAANCVRWTSAGGGDQAIYLDITFLDFPFEQFYWNGADPEAPQPLIKQWNVPYDTVIVGATGEVGTDDQTDPPYEPDQTFNTGELADWTNRDGLFYTRDNQDGTTVTVPVGIYEQNGYVYYPNGISFIEYALGSHGVHYDGPVDGVIQTFSVSGDCGMVNVENPGTGETAWLEPGDTVSNVVSSNYGTAFTFYTTDQNGVANCRPNDEISITIESEQQTQLQSAPLWELDDEEITIDFEVEPPTSKTPLLAWAGQRVILEHDWSEVDGSCPWATTDLGGYPGGPGLGGQGAFWVVYNLQSPMGEIRPLDGDTWLSVGPDSVAVLTYENEIEGVPSSGCISRVMTEWEDQGEIDVSAHVSFPVISAEVDFVVYYMKFESLSLGIVPGARAGHNENCVNYSPESCLQFTSDGADVTSYEANVSKDVLLRTKVRGWVDTTNCPARDSGVGSNGEFLPANRCIFPDDWDFKAGPDAINTRPEFDIWGGGGSTICSSTAGPFSFLSAPGCGAGAAPHVNGGVRSSEWPDGVINDSDAPMPPSLTRFQIDTGSGFLYGADKNDIYYGSNVNEFYVTHIPAEPWITPWVFTPSGLGGYEWDTWGGDGLYDFWDDEARTSGPITSCAGEDPPCDGAVATGGWDAIWVYSDNHGEAMAFINGDANLTWNDCVLDDENAAGHNIVQLDGYYCEDGDTVGNTVVSALADYPDKRKHFAIAADDTVSIEWTWGGIKEVTIEEGTSDQFNYVVFHVTDRDGFCSPSPSLHPVIGEDVFFVIESPEGIIWPNDNGDPAALLGSWNAKAAAVETFDTDDPDNAELVQTVQVAGECQAWIHVSESLLNEVDVLITAFDPEGTVTFDLIINEVIPTPEPTPSPSPTPETVTLIWGDTDCDGEVSTRDSQAILRNVLDQPALSVEEPCFGIGEDIVADGENQEWADWDCDNDVSTRDSQAVLRNVLDQAALSQTEPCPDVGDEVEILVN